MTARAKKTPATEGRGGIANNQTGNLQSLRTEYGLSHPTFARILGVPETTLETWEGGREQPSATALEKVEKVRELLAGLARVMRRDFIPTWLETPNDACKEAGARAPQDLMQRGDYDQIADMIFYFESGTPA